jgi:hypothetical protein
MKNATCEINLLAPFYALKTELAGSSDRSHRKTTQHADRRNEERAGANITTTSEMQLVKTTGRYYTNKEDTKTRSGQMDNTIVRKSLKNQGILNKNF